jgi:hypothetical protein
VRQLYAALKKRFERERDERLRMEGDALLRRCSGNPDCATLPVSTKSA